MKHKEQEWYPFLCVDDNREVMHVYTAQQAIEALLYEPFDIISLDYDLAVLNPNKTDPVINNGYTVAAWIAEHWKPDENSPRIFVHSWNTEQRVHMINVLKENGFHCYLTHFYVA